MPVLGPTDALFTDHQEAIIAALGCCRQSRPTIDLPCFCRFDGPRASYYVSDGTRDGMLYGAVLVEGQQPRVGHFHRSELQMLKRRGRLYRGDMLAGLITVNEVGRIAAMRFREGNSTTEIIPE